ncbi:PadR family transcriptional regulator [candidate division KSB1 bacterium]
MKFLTLNEEILMLSIWKLGDEAYGVKILDQYSSATGKAIVMGTLYNSLDYLVKKGFISTHRGEPTPERGGKRKVFYSVTKSGLEALKATKDLHESVWEDIPETIF